MTEINADQEEASDQEAETDQAREAEEVQDVAFFEVENLLRKRAPVPFISVLGAFLCNRMPESKGLTFSLVSGIFRGIYCQHPHFALVEAWKTEMPCSKQSIA